MNNDPERGHWWALALSFCLAQATSDIVGRDGIPWWVHFCIGLFVTLGVLQATDYWRKKIDEESP